MTTIEAIAEVTLGKLNPKPGDENSIEVEDLIESGRNHYLNIVWEQYIQAFAQEGDRTIFENLLKQLIIDVNEGDTTIKVSGLNVCTLPRDAGLHTIIPVDANNKPTSNPLIKTNAAAFFMVRRISTGPRYYRVEGKLNFPDGLPAGTKHLHIMFAGTTEKDFEEIPRDIAQQVQERLFNEYAPARGIPVDTTKNLNQNG